MRELWILFFSFFKIGLFTFGGGYAMLPLIEREVVENNKWATNEEILDIYSMSQCTPGVIAVNTATFIGQRVKGLLGSAFATLGVITPSLIIITIVATVLNQFAEIELVQHAFAGIRVAVAALIFTSCIKLVKSAIKSKVQVVIAVISFIAVTFFKLSPIVIIIASAVYGLFFIKIKDKDTKEDGGKLNE